MSDVIRVAGKDENGNDKEVSLGVSGASVHMLGDAGTGFGIAQNRQDSSVTTTRRRMSFPTGQGPTQVNAFLDDDGTGVQCHFVLNASNETQADAELADPVSQDSTTERYTVNDTSVQPTGQPAGSVTPIETIDYLLTGAGTNAVFRVLGA